jgi:hypothetical protein
VQGRPDGYRHPHSLPRPDLDGQYVQAFGPSRAPLCPKTRFDGLCTRNRARWSGGRVAATWRSGGLAPCRARSSEGPRRCGGGATSPPTPPAWRSRPQPHILGQSRSDGNLRKMSLGPVPRPLLALPGRRPGGAQMAVPLRRRNW